MNIIISIGIFIAFFQFILLLNKKGKSLPDKILAIWMLLIGIHFISHWITFLNLGYLALPFPLLYGPFLYLYTSYSLNNISHFKIKHLLHFIPTLIGQLYICALLIINDFHHPNPFIKYFMVALLIAFVVSILVYSYFSLKNIMIYQKLIAENFSNDDSINLTWLKSIIWGLLIMFGIGLFSTLFYKYTMVLPEHFFFFTLVSFISAFGYYGIRHQNIFIDNVIIEVNNDNKSESYKKSGLKESYAISKHQELQSLMEQEKPYLEPKLTLSKLAKLLDISPNHLSQIINQFENQNFNDFVNKYRIREFIKRATSNNQFSLLGNAFESGFNSKSTFNSVFKKQKGVTPSQYISNLKK